MDHKILFLFHAQYAVKKLKKELTEGGILANIIDAPRQLTSECELAVSAEFTNSTEYQSWLSSAVRAVYQNIGADYQLLWQDAN